MRINFLYFLQLNFQCINFVISAILPHNSSVNINSNKERGSKDFTSSLTTESPLNLISATPYTGRSFVQLGIYCGLEIAMSSPESSSIPDSISNLLTFVT